MSGSVGDAWNSGINRVAIDRINRKVCGVLLTHLNTMARLFLYATAVLLFVGVAQSFAQDKVGLQRKIEQIVAGKSAVVGVSIVGDNGKFKLYVNGDRHFPMQSVFKFHIGVVMLSEIDKGKFSLDQKVEIKKSELLPGFYSPIREKYPDGATLTIAEILEYTVSKSDNAGCDALLRLLGGPTVVETYFLKNNFKNISIKINEETMQSNWDMMFQNWTTPRAADKVLEAFYYNKKGLLSKTSHDFLWKIMRETETGAKRLKGQLPEGTVVAHKTGWSGTNEKTGITAAVNDIGVVFLPDGKHFFISVFVTDSKENIETNERIIADIAKAAWDHFTAAKK